MNVVTSYIGGYNFNHISKPVNKLKLNSLARLKVKECPCGKSNSDGKFVPFDGYEKHGYCHSCSKNFRPKGTFEPDVSFSPKRMATERRINFIDRQYLIQTMKSKATNYFVSFLKRCFGEGKAIDLIDLYKIGSSKKWRGANIFWYLDHSANIATGKIMLYNEYSGKRVKGQSPCITWVHTQLKMPIENIRRCFFGEHLLSLHKEKPIALVESEKTAIIASVYFSDYIWLATGGISKLSYEKMKVLRNRKVVLFPDLGAFDDWNEKAKEYTKWLDIRVSDYLEKIATPEEREQKLDLADYLISKLV